MKRIILLCLVLQSILSGNKDSDKKELATNIAKELVKKVEEYLGARVKDRCELQPVKEEDIKLSDEWMKEVTPIASFKCKEKSEEAITSNLDLDLLSVRLKYASPLIIFSLEHKNINTKIDVDENLIKNLEEHTKNYLEKCVKRFMERLDNVALNLKELELDLDFVEKNTDANKGSMVVPLPTISEVKIVKKPTDDERLNALYESVQGKLKPAAASGQAQQAKEESPSATLANHITFKVGFHNNKDNARNPTTASVFFIPNQNLIVVDIWSSRFNFQYEFNIVTRPFILNNIQNLLLRIDNEVFKTMDEILNRSLNKPLKFSLSEMLKGQQFDPKSEQKQDDQGQNPPANLPAVQVPETTHPSSFTSKNGKLNISFTDHHNILTVAVKYNEKGLSSGLADPAMKGVEIKKSFLNNSVYNLMPFIEEFVFSYASRFIPDWTPTQSGGANAQAVESGNDKPYEPVWLKVETDIDPFVKTVSPITGPSTVLSPFFDAEASKRFWYKFQPGASRRALQLAEPLLGVRNQIGQGLADNWNKISIALLTQDNELPSKLILL